MLFQHKHYDYRWKPSLIKRHSTEPPKPSISCFRANVASTDTKSPTRPNIFLSVISILPSLKLRPSRYAQLPIFTYIRCIKSLRLNPSQTNRVLSEIHSSLIPSWLRGIMRITSRPFVSTLIFEPQCIHNVYSFSFTKLPRTSCERIRLRVRAPTGHKSIIFLANCSNVSPK